METAKIFENGKSQAVRLPKKFRLSGDEVYVQKVGQAVVLMPKESAWEIFMDGINSFTEDFFADGRDAEFSTMRESL
jgi:antitoxin VapB